MVDIDPIAEPVLWTRGRGCGELAEAISGGRAIRVVGGVAEECIRHRARLLVTRKLSGFDLTSVAIPVDVDLSRASTVVAAVAGGPHSHLAARTAHLLGGALGVESFMACAYRDEQGKQAAVSTIENLFRLVPGLEYRLVEAPDAEGLLAMLPDDTLLVIGAPGGTWLQRTFFGPGAKLRGSTRAGTVVIRSAPPRVFQHMTDPVFVGPMRQAADILRIHGESVLAVVDQARLVGIVRRVALADAADGAVVGELMTEPVAVHLTDDMAELEGMDRFFEGSPVPVIDDLGILVGSIAG